MVHEPVPSNLWSTYIDATAAGGDWFMTGAAGTASGCNQTSYCDWDGVQEALDDGGEGAAVFTFGVTKGRDWKWVGAVDGLRLNDTIYDFEPFGVSEVAAP